MCSCICSTPSATFCAAGTNSLGLGTGSSPWPSSVGNWAGCRRSRARDCPCACRDVKPVREPDERNGHVRFDERGRRNGAMASSARATTKDVARCRRRRACTPPRFASTLPTKQRRAEVEVTEQDGGPREAGILGGHLSAVSCCSEMRYGWEAGILTPITWSRGVGSGVGDVGTCRFHSENRADRSAVCGRRRPFRAQSVKFPVKSSGGLIQAASMLPRSSQDGLDSCCR
jgi:hypothetical protein